VIAKGIMAIAEVSPRPHHAVCAFFKCSEHMSGSDPARTHHPDYPHVGRIFHPTHTCGIRSRIRTPVTCKNDDFGVKII
jgi:hypothetical protein